MTIKEKILAYLDYKAIKKTEFYELTGLSPSNFKGAAKSSELGCDKLVKILTSYRDLSVEWLLLNEGNMIKTNSASPEPIEPSSQLEQPKGTNNQQNNSEFLLAILSEMREKDTTIKEQAEEIGRLRERVYQLEKEKQVAGSSATNANDTGIANVG